MYLLQKTQKIRQIMLLCVALVSLPALANINVKLTSPQWEFLLKNEPWGESASANLNYTRQ